MSVPSEQIGPSLQAASDTAIAVAIASIIALHPNREGVRDALRKAFVEFPPQLANLGHPPELVDRMREVFQERLGMIRELERTLFP